MTRVIRILLAGGMAAALSGCAMAGQQAGVASASTAPSPVAVAAARPEAAATSDNAAGIANPAIWPAYQYPFKLDEAAEARQQALLGRMTVEEKVGQLVQADLCCVTPAEARAYNLGSILVGGNTGPYNNDLAPAADWLRAADEFYLASVDKSDGRAGIPIIWGVDAVHGHSNIIGATIFPHNIGLGAMRDSSVIERIGTATAKEIRVTGQEWTFAPTVAVPQDFRWGRAYEGYSSDPALVASYVGAMVRGLQGPATGSNLLAGPHVIASTKHFLADGGTLNGVDQGNAAISEEELRDIHGLPYGPAIAEGVSTVMVSFSAWQGRKMTGNHSLVTGVLKERMDFDGFVVSDWNAHGQVEGCTNESCPQALLAGVDMYMAPDTWKAVHADLLGRAKSGDIPMARIDEAVMRILRVKERVGLFSAGKPSARPLAGRYELLGAAEHRALAREAVRKSLVLLKNNGVLPIRPGGRLLVAGDGADDIARQSGGWTISWQGTGVDNSHFPGATSLYSGLKQAVEAGGGSAVLSPDGSFTQKPDAAVVIFGEKPYAEFQGDRATLALDADLQGPFATMERLKAQGIPVVAVMITGRPLYVNRALNLADGFVVAWLPGSEGAGLADVIVGGADGKQRHDFSGKLPAAWPMTPRMADGALFPLGYGLTYTAPQSPWTPLTEVDQSTAGDSRVWFAAGKPASSWSLLVGDATLGNQLRVTTVPAQALDGRMQVTAENYLVQEGARRFVLSGGNATIGLRTFEAINIDRETNGDVLLLFTLKVDRAPQTATIGARTDGAGAALNISLPQNSQFVRYGVPLKCLRENGADVTALTYPFVLGLSGPADISVGEVRLGTDAQTVLPCR